MPIKDFNTLLLSAQNKPITEKGVDGVETEVTMKTPISNALFAPVTDQVSGSEKAARFKLGMKVEVGGSLEFDAKEIAKMREVVGKAYNDPLVVGRVWDFLDA